MRLHNFVLNLTNIFIVKNPLKLTVIMSDYESIVLNFNIGTLKELHKRSLITSIELEKAVKMIKGQ
jgi:hypothetical protein